MYSFNVRISIWTPIHDVGDRLSGRNYMGVHFPKRDIPRLTNIAIERYWGQLTVVGGESLSDEYHSGQEWKDIWCPSAFSKRSGTEGYWVSKTSIWTLSTEPRVNIPHAR